MTPHADIVIRETVCKTILNRGSLSDYTLNCYTGCTHRCAYCYARFMQRFHPHDEPWGAFVDVKINAIEALKRQLRRAAPGDVFLSSACDGWQPIEADYRLTRRCCELLLERGFSLHILTKSRLVTRDFDIFRNQPVTVGVTLTTLDDRLQQIWEPGASSISDRIAILELAHCEGLKTSIMFGPILPFLSDDERSIEAMLRLAAQQNVDAVWFDALNLRPRVWSAIAALVQREFPDLLPRYSKILFDREFRTNYLAEVRSRLERAASQSELKGRVHPCM
jgi:DNA repair photolyase